MSCSIGFLLLLLSTSSLRPTLFSSCSKTQDAMSTDSTASNKRIHEDDDTLPQAKKPRQEDAGGERDEEFWENDGNVVLVARNVEFRVYKGVLAYHSPVFADMFSLPQPADASSETPHDCPVVHLDDSPEDLRHILRAILPRKTSK